MCPSAGRSLREVARLLDISPATVLRDERRALDKLAAAIEPRRAQPAPTGLRRCIQQARHDRWLEHVMRLRPFDPWPDEPPWP